MNTENIVLYSIRSKDGKWFRRKGYGGYGKTWVDDFKQARIYNKIGPARGVISFFSNKFSDYPTPYLVKFVVSNIELIDESVRVKEQKVKKEKAEKARDLRYKEWELKHLQDQIEETKKRINKIK